MTFPLANTFSVISLIQKQIKETNTVETILWDQMTSEVTDLMDRMSSVTCSILTENACIEKEILYAEQNQKRHTALDAARISLLSHQIEIIENEIVHLEQRIQQIESQVGLNIFKDKTPSITQYLESIEVVRRCFEKHIHALGYGNANDHDSYLTSEYKI
jgi:hypothetical protein